MFYRIDTSCLPKFHQLSLKVDLIFEDGHIKALGILTFELWLALNRPTRLKSFERYATKLIPISS